VELRVNVAGIEPDAARQCRCRDFDAVAIAIAVHGRVQTGSAPGDVFRRHEVDDAGRCRLALHLQREYGDGRCRIGAGEQVGVSIRARVDGRQRRDRHGLARIAQHGAIE
jgi:hypothetical protein